MTAKKRMRKSQKDFLIVLEKSMGLVSTACRKFGIARNTHYQWMKKYDDYREKVEEINERIIDFSESKLYENIKKGDPGSIFFHLKCKAKARGYIEKQQLEHSGKMDTNVTVTKKIEDYKAIFEKGE